MADFSCQLLKGIPFVTAQVEGKRFSFMGRFVVDTGAFMTIIRTARIDALGYSAYDAIEKCLTESIIGQEAGYKLKIKGFEVFGKYFDNFEVAAFDLPPRYQIDGLIGMNLLGQFSWCLLPHKTVISVK